MDKQKKDNILEYLGQAVDFRTEVSQQANFL